MLTDMGINVVETEEETEDTTEVAESAADRRGQDRVQHRRPRQTAPTIRCACTCARWARWSCLSREGEIAIAKRIEAGREAMISGPVRKPADLPGHHHLARRTRTKARSCCATSSTLRPPMPAPMPRRSRRRRRKSAKRKEKEARKAEAEKREKAAAEMRRCAPAPRQADDDVLSADDFEPAGRRRTTTTRTMTKKPTCRSPPWKRS